MNYLTLKPGQSSFRRNAPAAAEESSFLKKKSAVGFKVDESTELPKKPTIAPVRRLTTVVKQQLTDDAADTLQLLQDRQSRASVVLRGTHNLADMSTTHEGRHALLELGAVNVLVEELVSPDAATRESAMETLANLAEDAEDRPARAIAEHVVALLWKLQEEHGPPESCTAETLAAHAGILGAVVDLTELSRDMCLNFVAHHAIPVLLSFVKARACAARAHALAALCNLCHHVPTGRRVLAHDGNKPYVNGLPLLIVANQANAFACAMCNEGPTQDELRLETRHAVRIIAYSYGIVIGAELDSEDEKHKKEVLARHEKRNQEGRERASEKERTTRARLTEQRMRESDNEASLEI